MPSALVVARRYAEAVAALRAVHDFDAWMGLYWQERCPVPEIAAAAQATMGTANVIVWHESDETVFGFLPGYQGCFCIPRDLALPDFPFAATGSAASYGKDIVISAAMRDEAPPPGS